MKDKNFFINTLKFSETPAAFLELDDESMKNGFEKPFCKKIGILSIKLDGTWGFTFDENSHGKSHIFRLNILNGKINIKKIGSI